jgi:homoserine O-acetyltransferase
VHALNAAAANVSFVEVESDKGHDAFLLDEPRCSARCAASSRARRVPRGLHEHRRRSASTCS